MKIVFATNNKHKLEEARQLAPEGIEILSLADIGCHEEIPETCDTIEGNSMQKAEYIFKKYGCPCFSDDTGLFVDALNGAPGVYTARYAGETCSPQDNINKLLRELEGKTNRKAEFRTVATFYSKELIEQFEGSVKGVITENQSGASGFGYDPVFLPDEASVCFAEMNADSKNSVSHRGRALRAMFAHKHFNVKNC